MNSDADGFALEVTQVDQAAVVRLECELDLSTAPQLRQKLADLLAVGVRMVTVDMADMTFIDSSGLGVLVATMKQLRAASGDLTLQSPSLNTRKVFDITGLSKVFAITRLMATGWRSNPPHGLRRSGDTPRNLLTPDEPDKKSF